MNTKPSNVVENDDNKNKPKFIALKNLPKMVLIELPFLVNKKHFIEPQISSSSKQQQHNNNNNNNSKFSPIVDGFLGGAANIYLHTFGAKLPSTFVTANQKQPQQHFRKNRDQPNQIQEGNSTSNSAGTESTKLKPQFPQMRRSLAFPISNNNSNNNSETNQRQQQQHQLSNSTYLTMSQTSPSATVSRSSALFGSTSVFNNKNQNSRSKTVSAIFSAASNPESSSHANQYQNNTNNNDNYNNSSSPFNSSFDVAITPFVDGKCIPCSDILVKVTYTRKIITKVVTLVTRRRRKTSKTEEVVKKEEQQQQHQQPLQGEDNKKKASRRILKTETKTSNFQAKPVSIVKWAIEFKTPADWIHGLHCDASLAMMNSAIQKKNTNANHNLLPSPCLISTRADLVNSKVIHTLRCNSPINLMSALEDEGKIPKSHSALATASSNNEENQTVPRFTASLVLNGDPDISPHVPEKMRKELFRFVSLPRFIPEKLALQHLFEVVRPNTMMYQTDKLIELVAETWSNLRKNLHLQKKGSSVKETPTTKDSKPKTKVDEKKEADVDEATKKSQRAALLSTAVSECGSVSLETTKLIVRGCTYCFSGGPFRLYRIRYGYDPRAQPKDVHKKDQLLVVKYIDHVKQLVEDTWEVARKAASQQQATNGNNNSKNENLPFDFLKRVLINIRLNYVNSLSLDESSSSSSSTQRDHHLSKSTTITNSKKSAMKSASKGSNNNGTFSMFRPDSQVPQHDFFSRLLLARKHYNILFVGDFWAVPSYREILEDGELATYDAESGWFAKKSIAEVFKTFQANFSSWLRDVVAPRISENVKTVDFFSMMTESSSSSTANNNTNNIASLLSKNNSSNVSQNNSQNIDLNDIFGHFYGETTNENNNNIMENNSKKPPQSPVKNKTSFFDMYSSSDDDDDNTKGGEQKKIKKTYHDQLDDDEPLPSQMNQSHMSRTNTDDDEKNNNQHHQNELKNLQFEEGAFDDDGNAGDDDFYYDNEEDFDPLAFDDEGDDDDVFCFNDDDEQNEEDDGDDLPRDNNKKSKKVDSTKKSKKRDPEEEDTNPEEMDLLKFIAENNKKTENKIFHSRRSMSMSGDFGNSLAPQRRDREGSIYDGGDVTSNNSNNNRLSQQQQQPTMLTISGLVAGARGKGRSVSADILSQAFGLNHHKEIVEGGYRDKSSEFKL